MDRTSDPQLPPDPEHALRASEEKQRLLAVEAERLEGVVRAAGGLAHDLNNQLTAILAGAEVVAEAVPNDPGLVPVLAGIRDAALRSARLTRQLLSLTRRDAPPPEAAAATAEPVRPLHVLVVDDEPNVRRTLSLLLRAYGHTAEECAGGAEALARYREAWRAIDVVILDMTLPDLHGEEVLARLRAIDPAVGVVVSSGFSVRLDAGAAGGVRLLQKPYTPEELARALAAAARGAPR